MGHTGGLHGPGGYAQQQRCGEEHLHSHNFVATSSEAPTRRESLWKFGSVSGPIQVPTQIPIHIPSRRIQVTNEVPLTRALSHHLEGAPNFHPISHD